MYKFKLKLFALWIKLCGIYLLYNLVPLRVKKQFEWIIGHPTEYIVFVISYVICLLNWLGNKTFWASLLEFILAFTADFINNAFTYLQYIFYA